MNDPAKPNSSSSHYRERTNASFESSHRLGKDSSRIRWRWLLPLLGISIAIGIGGFHWNSRRQKEAKTDLAKLSVPVRQKELAIRVEASGTVQPVSSVNISPKTTGRLVALYVDQGDRVKAGQILAKMDASDLEAELVQVKAQLLQAEAAYEEVVNGSPTEEISRAKVALESARASVDLSSARLERYRMLANSGAVSANDLDGYVSEDRRARASLEQARQQLQELLKGSRPEKVKQSRAQVAAARAQIKLIQTRYDDTIIKAPFDGQVTQKYATVGAIVTPTTSASATASATSSSIVALASGLEVVVYVPEADIGQIESKQEVEIVALSYRNRTFAGRVKRIAPEAIVQDKVTSFQVKVELVDPHSQLRSGMNVEVTFIGKKIPNALVVPTVAISDRDGQIGVMSLDSENEPRFQPIEAGMTQDGQTQVLKGLTLKDRVLLDSPAQKLSRPDNARTERMLRRTLMR